MSEKTMTLREAEALIAAFAGPEDFGVPARFAQAAKNYAEFIRAHLAQRAEVDAEERAVGVCSCGMAGIMVERNGERVCSDCRPADRAEVK